MGDKNAKSGSKHTKSINNDRRCKKAWKKHPGVAPKAHSGKTRDGYSTNPDSVAARERRKAAARAKHLARTA